MVVEKVTGRSYALNFNADWTGNAGKVVDAEFCG
jgi:hypothetical protein